MKKSAFAVGSMMMLSLFTAGTAEAALMDVNGYVCSATYTRQNHVSFGQGYVQVQMYAGPKCTGGLLGTYYYLGSGATASGYQFSEAERLQLFERATLAATQGTRVNLFVETTGGGILHTTYIAS